MTKSKHGWNVSLFDPHIGKRRLLSDFERNFSGAGRKPIYFDTKAQAQDFLRNTSNETKKKYKTRIVKGEK